MMKVIKGETEIRTVDLIHFHFPKFEIPPFSEKDRDLFSEEEGGFEPGYASIIIIMNESEYFV